MSITVTRYEEVGKVYDFGVRNMMIVAFIAFCLVAVTVAIVVHAMARSRCRRWGVPGVVAGVVIVVFAVFFGAGIYRSPIFPHPHTTAKDILAQSVRTAALAALRDAYGVPVVIDAGSALASDSADMRWARPRTLSIDFHIRRGDRQIACHGKLFVTSAVPAARAVNAPVDRIDPGTGVPSNTYMPVTVTSDCAG